VATVTATATPGTNPYVNVALASFVESSVTVVRIDDAGNEVLVRNGDPLTLSGGSGLIQDYETPLDTNQHWEARNVSSGATIATSATVQLDSGGNVYLGHPGKPSLNMQVILAEWQPGTRASRSATFHVIGKRLPVARSFRRAGHAGSMVVRCDTFAQLNQLNDLLDDGYPLIIRAPADPEWGIGTRYLSVGDVSEEMRVRTPTRPRRWISLPWVEVQRPAGLAQAGPGFSWQDVINTYATWQDLISANPDWASVIDGVP
jgi:hypothetical protein